MLLSCTQEDSPKMKIDEGPAIPITIETISLQDFERKVLAKEDMNVIVSSSTCYYCLAFEPIVHEVLTELGKKVYRINTYVLNDEDLKTFRSYYPYTTTPTIFTTKDGFSHRISFWWRKTTLSRSVYTCYG